MLVALRPSQLLLEVGALKLMNVPPLPSDEEVTVSPSKVPDKLKVRAEVPARLTVSVLLVES